MLEPSLLEEDLSFLEEDLSSPPDDFDSVDSVDEVSLESPFDPFPGDELYPSAYQPPPLRMKAEAEIRRRTFERQTLQRLSGSAVIR